MRKNIKKILGMAVIIAMIFSNFSFSIKADNINREDLLLNETFSGSFPPAGWQIDAHEENWLRSDTNNAGGLSPEAKFCWNPSFDEVSRLYTILDTSGYNWLNISFMHYVDGYSYGNADYTLRVQVSTDGSTWHDIWTFDGITGTYGPAKEKIIITDNEGVGSSSLYLAFVFDGYSWDIDYWYIDNVTVFATFLEPDIRVEPAHIDMQWPSEGNKTFSKNGMEILLMQTSDKLKINYHINDYDLKKVIIDEKEYYKIILGEEPNIMEKGKPALPCINRSIIIPDKAKVEVRVVDSKYKEYSPINIVPSKGCITRDIDPSKIPYTFDEVYTKNEWFPGKVAQLGKPYIIHDYRGIVVRINPFQYNPVTKTLRVYNDITIEIYSNGTDVVNVIERDSPPSKINSYFRLIYGRHFINFLDSRYAPVDEEGEMLIICYDDFYDEMLPFVDWKNMKGIKTTIVNVSSIGNESAIKDYIANYYNTHDLAFVLLVGDVDQVPTLYSAGGASDPSYSYVAGDDHYPDLFVGRFSAQTEEHVITQVNRTIQYEKYPQALDWYSKGTGIGSDEGAGDDNEYDWEHIRNIRSDLLNYTYTLVDEFYGGSQGGNDAPGNPDANDIASALNEGRSVINYCGHGSYDGWGWNSVSGWYVFQISDVNNLVNENMLPFIWSVACNNGEFNNYSTCFAEAWLRATNNGKPTGAIAVFMSSISQSWSPPMDAQDEIVDIIVESYADNMKITFGGLSFNGCMHMNDEYGQQGYDMTDTWHVFGDPSLQVYTTVPSSMNVQHEDSISAGDTSLEVTVDGIEKALCAISKNGTLLGYNYTDANGHTTIHFDPVEEGELTLVVTAKNRIPYIATIEVGKIRQPAEFEQMEGVLIRYPFGISYDVIKEMNEEAVVVTIVADENEKNYVESQYQAYGIQNYSFLIASTDTYWTRDYGPWFAFYGKELVVINFTYNRPRPNDDSIPERFAEAYGMKIYNMSLVHTGGNYMTDGHGIAVSTDLVWEENSNMTHEKINATVEEYLGIETYHVVPDALGEYIKHIDCWAKYLAPDVIMVIEVPSDHPQYDEIEEAVAYFENQTSCYGWNYKIVRVYTPNGEPYINSLILNHKVLVPVTGSEWDDDAIQAYQEAMPGYEIVGVEGSWLTTDALHCRTKGIPDRGMLYIEHTPLQNCSPSENGFLVEAEIIAYSGANITNASVYWKVEGGSWNVVEMSFNNDEYQAYIPEQPYGTVIYYYIHAEDSSGRQTNHPYVGALGAHSFMSLGDIATVATNNASNVSYHSAKLNGYLKDIGGSACQVWFVYDTVYHDKWQDYAYNTSKKFMTSSGIFSCNASGLTHGTTYHFRAIASNDAGAAMGDDLTFTTLANISSELLAIYNDGDGNLIISDITVHYRNREPAGWLTAKPTSFIVSPSSVEYVNVSADSTLLQAGEYHAWLLIYSNDPDESLYNVTVNLTVISLNQPPTASFSFTPINPTSADTVSFIDKSTDLDGSIVNWTWSFGDGNISYEKNPTHKYADNGVYNVTLTVTDDDGATNSTYKLINVDNAQPTAQFKYSPADLYTIQFTDLSYDNDGSIVNYTWDFGDGNISYEQNPVHQYADAGTYNVTLTVTDDDGATDSISKNVSVWTSRKPINLWVPSGKTPAYYQVLLNISYDANMNPDFSDLRFIRYADNTTELDYWIERKVDAQWANVWVEIADNITTANKTLAWLYYGNPNATSASNGSATFLFFDDFNDGVWDDKWNIDKNTDGIGLVYQLNGKLFLRTKEVSRTISIITKNSFESSFDEYNGTILEYDAWTKYNPPYPKSKDGKLRSYIIAAGKWIASSYSGWSGNVKLYDSNGNSSLLGRTSRRTCNIHAFVSLGCNISNAWMRWKEINDPAWIEDDFNSSITTNMTTTSIKIKLELHCGGEKEGQWSQIAFDNLKLRRYHNPEPEYYIGDEINSSRERVINDLTDISADDISIDSMNIANVHEKSDSVIFQENISNDVYGKENKITKSGIISSFEIILFLACITTVFNKKEKKQK